MTKVALHVPSTTFVSRGLNYLAPTDGEFLLNQNKIDEDDALCIVMYNLKQFLNLSDKRYDIMTSLEFSNYCELRHAPKLRALFMSYTSEHADDLDLDTFDTKFNSLNSKWYSYLLNQYVKVSRFNNTVEFRISSEDNYNWNEIIIDYVILDEKYSMSNCTFNIMRESSKGYKAYFMSATLDDILDNDSAILSSRLYKRKVINGELKYIGE